MELRIVHVQPKLGAIEEISRVRYKTEIPTIHLVQNGDASAEEDKKEVAKPKNTEISETMEVSNFIQSEQQHAITTSEYSSLSSLSSPPLSFSSRLPPDGQEFPPTCQESQTRSDQDSLVTKCDPVMNINPLSSASTWGKNNQDSREKTSLWRKDQSSAGSVKDKIAIFNSGENSEPLLPLTKTYKSSENISMDKTDLYNNKKNKFSKSCLCVNNIPSTPKDNQNQSNNTEDNQKEMDKKEDTFEFAKPSLTYASSFSTKPTTRLHSRSQSLLDMSSLDAPWNNPDNRRLTLNHLIEQRRRGLSKLRGLVIPQTDVPAAEPVLDLPVIHSKESTLVSQASTRSKSESTEPAQHGHQRSNSTSLQSPSWKNNSISNLPRYSPAFKRKCLQVYVMEQSSTGPIPNNNCSPKTPDSMFHSDYETNNSLTSTSLNSIPTDDVFSKNNYEHLKVEPAKSVENITSPSNSEISFEYSYQSTNSNNSIDTPNENNYYAKKSCQVSKVKNDTGRSEEDSDNDSAVSSSQSSYISRECSPLPSPLQDYTNNTHLIPIQEVSSERQNLSKSKDLYAAQTNNNSRVLKPQSVEAINRKNILASAKCRSGRDFKNGSPLIQRKLNGNDEEKNTVEQKPAELESSTDKEKVAAVETNGNGNNEEDDTDKHSTSSSAESVSTESVKSQESDIQPEIKKCDTKIISPPQKLPVPETKPVVQPAPVNELEKVVLRNTSKLNTTVQLRHSTSTATALPTPRKYSFDALDRPTSIQIPTSSRYDANKRASVNDIRKQFEKFEQENQKSPEPKSPSTRNFTKNIITKSPTVKSPVETKVFGSTVVKETKSTPKIDSKPTTQPATVNISQEELEQIVKEVNEGIDKTNDLYINRNEIIIVVLHREIAGGSIGITLTGGTDYEAKEITVHKVLTGSCAHKDGRLKKGDRILAINGKKMLGLTHKESIDILKDPKPEVSLVVLPFKGKVTPVSTLNTIRKASSEASIVEEISESSSLSESPVSKEGLIRVELIKDGAGLGFSLDGGRDSPKGDKPLIIKKIFTGGAAEKCGLLQGGDELIEVNDVEVYKMTRIEVWSMMKKLPDGKVSLTIRR